MLSKCGSLPRHWSTLRVCGFAFAALAAGRASAEPLPSPIDALGEDVIRAFTEPVSLVLYGSAVVSTVAMVPTGADHAVRVAVVRRSRAPLGIRRVLWWLRIAPRGVARTLRERPRRERPISRGSGERRAAGARGHVRDHRSSQSGNGPTFSTSRRRSKRGRSPPTSRVRDRVLAVRFCGSLRLALRAHVFFVRGCGGSFRIFGFDCRSPGCVSNRNFDRHGHGRRRSALDVRRPRGRVHRSGDRMVRRFGLPRTREPLEATNCEAFPFRAVARRRPWPRARHGPLSDGVHGSPRKGDGPSTTGRPSPRAPGARVPLAPCSPGNMNGRFTTLGAARGRGSRRGRAGPWPMLRPSSAARRA